jgi:SAM-dependent methyltransferase
MELQQIKKRIKNLYSNISGYSLDKNDPYNNLNNFKNKSDVVSTYGEITPNGVSKIIENLFISKNDVFYDLGCGTGKVVTQFYYQTCVKSSNGVEFSTTRFKDAIKIKSKIENQEGKNERINFFRYNFLNKKLDLSNGTIFYSASTCFEDKTMYKLWEKIHGNPNLNAIILLTEFPSKCDLSRVKRIKDINVTCSWSKSNAKIYYFK